MNTTLLTLMLWLPLGATAQTSNPLRDSLRVASESLSYYPDSVDLRLRRASWYVQLEEWQSAKNDYDIVLRHNPANIAALYYRAYVNDRLGRYKFSRLDYQNLLTLVPGNYEASLGLALLNEKDKHYTEAIDGINQLVDAYPDSAVVWAARAGIENERGMLELAEYDYGKAISLEPDNNDFILSRADIRIKLGEFQNAIEDLDLLVKLGTPRAALKEWYDKALSRKKK